MKESFIYAANWKMQFSFENAIEYAKNNKTGFINLAKKNIIVLCPSFPALYPIIQLFNETNVKIGAQNCAEFNKGPYTGEVSATSIAQVGCSYCIIGHSERRSHFHETNDEITKKLVLLLEQKITPIVCVGELKHEYESNQTHHVLEAQLTPLYHAIEKSNFKSEICLAYEPVWAIGTGLVPDNKYLEGVIKWIWEFCQEKAKNGQFKLLYGGSVNEQTIVPIKQIPLLDGFLIGGASLDFQKFEKIVSL